MVTLFSDSRISDRRHFLRAKKDQPTFKKDGVFVVNIQNMDTRYMVFSALGYGTSYHVFTTKQEIDESFDEMSYDEYLKITQPQ